MVMFLGITLLEVLTEDAFFLLFLLLRLTLDGIVFVVGPEIFKFFLSVLDDGRGGGVLVVHLHVVGSQDQLHAAGAPVAERLPTLVHHPIDGHIVPWRHSTIPE